MILRLITYLGIPCVDGLSNGTPGFLGRHTYIGDFIKYTQHLYVPPTRDMESLRVLLIFSNYAFYHHNHTIGKDKFVSASRISK